MAEQKAEGRMGNGLEGEFADCAAVGASFDDKCAGRLVDCSVTGTQGVAVQDNGRVDLVSLRTSLLVVPQTAKPVEPAPTIVNNYHGPVINNFNGPVFNAAVYSAQLAWNNNSAIQQQTREGGSGG